MKYMSKKLVQAHANDNFACVLKSAIENHRLMHIIIARSLEQLNK